MDKSNAVSIISKLLTTLAVAYADRPRAAAQVNALNDQLRGFIDEGRDPSEAEWAALRQQTDGLMDSLRSRAEEAQKHLDAQG